MLASVDSRRSEASQLKPPQPKQAQPQQSQSEQSQSEQSQSKEKSVVPPSVVNARLIQPFSYWHQGIQQGMRYQNELYTQGASFPVTERLKAYAIAYEYTEQRIDVCITVSKTAYTLWLNLRSLSAIPTSHATTTAYEPSV